MPTMTSDEFAQKIKAKYPQYASLDNATLTQKMLAKYPQYQSQVSQTSNQPQSLVQGLDSTTHADRAWSPSTGNEIQESGLLGGLARITKNVASNIIPSSVGFANATFQFFNPLNTLATLSKIPEAAKGAYDAYGGNVLKATQETLKEATPQFGEGGHIGAAAETVLPKFLIHIAQNDPQKAAATIENDPVGQILPLVMVARQAAQSKGYGQQFDSAISTVAKPVTATGEYVGSKAASAFNTLITKPTKFAIGQMTGMSQDTIGQVLTNPEAFTKEMQGTMSRAGLGNEVAGLLAQREGTLNETGTHYGPIREAKSPVSVNPTWLTDTVTKETGLQITPSEGGYKVDALPTSKLRASSDVRAVQNLVDFWQPVFERGVMTSEEFLNFRSDLAELSKFDRQIGKSHPLEASAQRIRGALNTEYRPQVPNLENTDTTFASQLSDFNRLKQGVLDSKGNLTDAAINRIANAANPTRDIFGKQLEEISPGIIGKIKILKAYEDIKASMDNKVGTYTRAGLGVGGILTGIFTLNPYVILGVIMTVPEVALPILRGVGMSAEKAGNVLNLIGQGLDAVNQLPNYVGGTKNPQENTPIEKSTNAFDKYIKANPPSLGMSVKDVDKMTPEELAAQGIEKSNNLKIYHGSRDLSWYDRGEQIKPSETGFLGNPGVFFTKDMLQAKGWSEVGKKSNEVSNRGVLELKKAGNSSFNLKEITSKKYEELMFEAFNKLQKNPSKYGTDKYGVNETKAWNIVHDDLIKQGYDGIIHPEHGDGILFSGKSVEATKITREQNAILQIEQQLGVAKNTDPACVKFYRDFVKKNPEATPIRGIFAASLEAAKEKYQQNIQRGTQNQLGGFTHIKALLDGVYHDNNPSATQGSQFFSENQILGVQKAEASGLEKYKIRGAEISPNELDTLKGVLFAEISNRSLDKQKLEARVIVNTAINRMLEKKGATLNDIISAPHQYQGYESPEFMRYMEGKVTKNDQQKLDAIEAIIKEIQDGTLPNPINDYTFYYHKPDGSITATKKFMFSTKKK